MFVGVGFGVARPWEELALSSGEHDRWAGSPEVATATAHDAKLARMEFMGKGLDKVHVRAVRLTRGLAQMGRGYGCVVVKGEEGGWEADDGEGEGGGGRGGIGTTLAYWRLGAAVRPAGRRVVIFIEVTVGMAMAGS